MLRNCSLQLFNGHRHGMHALCICLFVICGVSARWRPSLPQFRFYKDLGFMFRRSADNSGCILCYGDGNDCIAMNIYRCEYYVTTSDVLDSPESPNEDPLVPIPGLRADVDTMMFDLVDKASKDPHNKDCIPYISRFTDCTRENICVGCKACECDSDGAWNCTAVQKCRVDVTKLHADHRTLIMVLEHLRNSDTTPSRVKRADAEIPPTSKGKLTYAQIAEWMYGVPPTNINQANSSIAMRAPGRSTTETDSTVTATTTEFDMETDKEVIETKSKEKRNETEVNKISFAEISEWVNNFHPAKRTTGSAIDLQSILDVSTETPAATTETPANEIKVTKINPEILTMKPDSDNLDFEEVLHSLAVDNKTNIRRKLPLSVNHNEGISDHDYVNYDVGNINLFDNFETNDRALHIPYTDKDESSMTETSMTGATRPMEEFTRAVTETVIDLLQSAKEKHDLNYRTGKNIVFTDYYDLVDKDYKPHFEETNNIDQADAVNVMKRDVSFVTKITENTTLTPNSTDNNNNTSSLITSKVNNSYFQELKDVKMNILQSLNNIINNKHREISELFKLQQSLIVFFNNYENLDLNATDKNITRKLSFTPSSILREEDTSTHPFSLRIDNTTLLEKYTAKLKHDVYEVIRDIVGIRQLSDPINIPEDLKFLMRAMKYYVYKQNFHQSKHKLLSHRNPRRKLEPYDDGDHQLIVKANSYEQNNIYTRRKSDLLDQSDINTRHFNSNDDTTFQSDCVKDRIIKIIEAIDRNMPLSNSLNPLSRDAKKVVKRIIKQHYVDEFAVAGLRIYDPHYNLTNDLRNIGTKWQDMAAAVKNSAPSDKLYAMKLLHLELSTDINKLNDVLALVNFAHTRRMVPVEESAGESIMGKITSDLIDIGKQISTVFSTDESEPEKLNLERQWTTPHTTRKPKMSFLKQIKHLLKSSKNDILGLLRKKIPKSEIFKELARKQLDVLTRRKLSEYEQTMQKWQYNLGIVTPRSKRSVPDFDKMRNRIKNILPKYLRGKVPSRNRPSNGFKNKTNAHKKKTTTKKKITSTVKSKSH